MVIDKIHNIHLYYGLSEGVMAGLKYLKDNDFEKLEPGKYPIDGDNVFALVQNYNSQLSEDGKWEAHRRFIDIQYIAKGAEMIGYANLESLNVTKEYDSKIDALFLEGNGNMLLCKGGHS